MVVAMRAGLVLGLIFGLLSSAAWANAPPPPEQFPEPLPPKPVPAKVVSKQTAPVVVKHADLAKDGAGVKAKIVIPRKLLAEAAPAAEPRASIGEPRSIIAGLMLSLAAVSVVFVARGKRWAKATAAAGVVAAIVCVSAPLWGDVRVPGRPYNGPARRPVEEPVRDSTIILEIVDEGDTVTLTLPGK